MIRVNLTRSRIPTGGDEATVAGSGFNATEFNQTDNRELLVKFAIMLMGVLGLWIYEKQNIDQLTTKNVSAAAQLNEIKKRVGDKLVELAKLKDIEPQAQALNDKLKILREYSKLRLENLQSLDFLQSVIPERVWLKTVSYQSRKYDVHGNAMETVDLTDFVNKMEGSAYFTDVIVIEDRDVAVLGGKIRDFELTARAGVKN